MNVRPLILTAAAAAALVATPAFADSIRVEYKDLDLSSDAGRTTLQNRIESAARDVCGVRKTNTGTRMPMGKARKCYDDVMADMNQSFATMLGRAKGEG
jgi:UrcA family protein